MKKSKNLIKDICCLFSGSIFYSVSVLFFTAKNEILPGGATGIATVFNHILSLPIGLGVLLINIPLFILGAKILGLHYISKSALATLIMSLALDILSPVIPAFSGDRFIATLFGGVLSGIGLSLVFLRGASTGGSDLAAAIINNKFPRFSIGKIIFTIDLAVCALSLPIYKSIESTLYSLTLFFVSSYVVDKMLYGTERGKVCFIITKKGEEVSKKLLFTLSRGVTKIDALGAYTQSDTNILLCVIRPRQFYELLSVVKEIDKGSFIIVSDASNVKGEGFLPL